MSFSAFAARRVINTRSALVGSFFPLTAANRSFRFWFFLWAFDGMAGDAVEGLWEEDADSGGEGDGGLGDEAVGAEGGSAGRYLSVIERE